MEKKKQNANKMNKKNRNRQSTQISKKLNRKFASCEEFIETVLKIH